MASKYVFLFLVFQTAQLCFAQDATTVINVEADLKGGVLVPSNYVATANLLPAVPQIPAEIRVATTLGVWWFDKTGGELVLTSTHPFDSITLRVFSTAEAKVIFDDMSTDAGPSAPMTIAANGQDFPKSWADRTFEFKRSAASAEIFSLRVAFTAGVEGDLFLIDSISITNTEEASTTPDNGSSAMAPALITFVMLAVLKAFL